MVTFKLISINGNIIHYEYYPTGDENYPGTLIFDDFNKKVIKKIYSKMDTECGSYMGHFVRGMRDNNGNFKEKGFCAWC